MPGSLGYGGDPKAVDVEMLQAPAAGTAVGVLGWLQASWKSWIALARGSGRVVN